jgi:hypothetical protein
MYYYLQVITTWVQYQLVQLNEHPGESGKNIIQFAFFIEN